MVKPSEEDKQFFTTCLFNCLWEVLNEDPKFADEYYAYIARQSGRSEIEVRDRLAKHHIEYMKLDIQLDDEDSMDSAQL